MLVRKMLFDPAHLPPSEQAAGRQILNNVADLNGYIEKFRYALSLFDFCANQAARAGHTQLEHLVGWQRIAARDGAMSVWHFWKTMGGTTETIQLCHSLSRVVDRTKFKLARKIFDERFKNFEAMRNAVAHSGELKSTMRARSRNSLTGSHNGGAY